MTTSSNFVLTALFVVLISSSCCALEAIPTFELNLDLPPIQRWDGAVKKIVDAHGWENSFGPVIDLYIPLFLLFPANLSVELTAHLAANYPDVLGEVTGIGQQLAEYGCSLCNSTFMNAFVYFYELSHVSSFKNVIPAQLRKSCTGILSLPRNMSLDIIHGRNMDESPHQGRNMTLNVKVTRGGKHLYNMIDWTWVTAGIATTSRIGGVTLEMNWNNDGPDLSLSQIVSRILDTKTVPVLQSFRIINDAAMNFEQAVTFISTSQFASPYYNIVSGTGRRGAVLTIEFDVANNVVQFINDTSSTTFMVQTNYDRWLPDPSSDPRRTVAEDALTMLGRDRSGTELGVWMALSTYPVHNTGTLFTALMSVAKQPEAYIRVAMRPVTYLK